MFVFSSYNLDFRYFNRIPVVAVLVSITELVKLVLPAKDFDVSVFTDLLEKTAVVL